LYGGHTFTRVHPLKLRLGRS